jgi:hypothetical protein
MMELVVLGLIRPVLLANRKLDLVVLATPPQYTRMGEPPKPLLDMEPTDSSAKVLRQLVGLKSPRKLKQSYQHPSINLQKFGMSFLEEDLLLAGQEVPLAEEDLLLRKR